MDVLKVKIRMYMKNLSKVRQHKAPEGFHRLTSIIGIGMVTKKELRDDLPQLNSLDLLAARLY
ncbi:hypothetical protein EY672_01375 [Enterococcus gallinarum]|nr:hypothetical protein [Enterococcus gallinarum]MBO6351494.1 hypothetical protein [Enterococcus gallinarum]MBO6393274.1 hypothetical protein [Enterococcus gallinarum]MBO6425707.1 hypothetical protein [Enterococcus gallinarum]TKL08561.1 hypothetical protein DVW06_01350 [Enterococcus sp. ARL09-542]